MLLQNPDFRSISGTFASVNEFGGDFDKSLRTGDLDHGSRQAHSALLGVAVHQDFTRPRAQDVDRKPLLPAGATPQKWMEKAGDQPLCWGRSREEGRRGSLEPEIRAFRSGEEAWMWTAGDPCPDAVTATSSRLRENQVYKASWFERPRTLTKQHWPPCGHSYRWDTGARTDDITQQFCVSEAKFYFDVANRLTGQIVDKSLVFNIRISDVNDHAPQFPEKEFNISVKENHTAGVHGGASGLPVLSAP
ncbi:hypothetical protein E2I00_017044 [Balaenoptera physalus]|uniref:Cadherin domain-containing protein n=1 Tax=Balaenoptera physalus TaxID=9770 RepID=A0A6A1QA93_BALPH|nr:hypothetical protein E2I00_017044 [Balaenoptera physalus]